MDFAYRYTAGVLGDALHLSAEGYGSTASGSGNSGAAARSEGSVNLGALRLAVASRLEYQFKGTMPKDFSLAGVGAGEESDGVAEGGSGVWG